jgi:hypothetical protein
VLHRLISRVAKNSRPLFSPLLLVVFVTHLYSTWSLAAQLPQSSPQSQSVELPKTHSYLDDSTGDLLQRVPELKSLSPDSDQRQLPEILDKTGSAIDGLFTNFVDVIANEEITQQRNEIIGSHDTRKYQYIFLLDTSKSPSPLREIRTDLQGHPVDTEQALINYFRTNSFEVNLMYFSKELQHESAFRYLGQQRIDGRLAYVVAFAQLPGKTTHSISIKAEAIQIASLLLQGIAWIDPGTFQILQIRTDPLQLELEPGQPSRPFQLSTIVSFVKVHAYGVPHAMWLPRSARVYADFGPESGSHTGPGAPVFFANEHRFYQYRLFNPPDGSVPSAGGSAGPVPYFNEPLLQLLKRVPELNGLKPAANQQPLPDVLRKTGEAVNQFFLDIIDLIADEELKQFRRAGAGDCSGGTFHDSYLIVRGDKGRQLDFDEFRMDKKGNRLDNLGQKTGCVVTGGFALISTYFAPDFQPDSDFRLLGTQEFSGRPSYVIGFAQIPGKATYAVDMRFRGSLVTQLLAQGIAWVDTQDFHILRIRTDLLAPQPQVGLSLQTTEVQFSPVRLRDTSNPLWLPRDVKVTVVVGAHNPFNPSPFVQIFQNEHHYSNYRQYRVTSKMLTPN